MKKYPKIYLAMDNCVFYKRFTRPDEWMKKMRDLGIHYVEASADTEMDPLYMGREYLHDWVGRTREASEKYGVQIGNLYSGHGTYTTLGLTHYDKRVRQNILENWFYPMVDISAELGCGMGFYAHAFNQDVLQNRESYAENVDLLYNQLAAVNAYAREKHVGNLSVEKMYTPHQYPWRMTDVMDLIRQVSERSGKPFYFTEDLGHHHIKFLRPEKEDAEKAIRDNNGRGVWLGSDRAYELFDRYGMDAWDQIEEDMDENPQLFSTKEDGDCYVMLRRLGCYAPIIHLQQTDGTFSEHRPFTVRENNRGKINGRQVLLALKESYDRTDIDGMPERVTEIYMTLELFSSTTSIMHDVLKDCRESVEYWRRFIPEDGTDLGTLVENLPEQ